MLLKFFKYFTSSTFFLKQSQELILILFSFYVGRNSQESLANDTKVLYKDQKWLINSKRMGEIVQ